MPAPKGNKNAVGNTGGRPPIHTDPKKVDELVNDYFQWIDGEYELVKKTVDGKEIEVKKYSRYPEPPTVTGLTLHLGFAHKDSLYKYAKKVEFYDSIKRGLTQIEKYHEILTSKGDKCTGNIFILKNFGWKDKTEQEITGNQTIIWREEKTYEADKETDDGS